MWKTMSFELDAEAQGRCDCFVKPVRKTERRARGGQGKRVIVAALEERVGVARSDAAAAATRLRPKSAGELDCSPH